MRELLCRSAAETEAAGEDLARGLVAGDLVLLEGELGAGKTTFVRGVARGLGLTDQVQSPTFQLVRVYRGPLQVAHVDLYRLGDTAELGELGLGELLDEGVLIVEWGDRLRLDYSRTRRVSFTVTPGHQRLLRFE